MDLRCAKCGSGKIIPQANCFIDDPRIISDRNLKAYVCSHPKALIFKGAVSTSLMARICSECGHTELFAVSPRPVYEAYLEAQESQS